SVPLLLISSTVLELAVVALGIPVTFYYGTTGFACAWYYRDEIFKSVKKFVLVGLLPFVGGLMFYGILYKAVTYYGHKANAEGKEYLGLTLPLWFGAVGMGVGLVVMLISRRHFKQFFSRKTEAAPEGILDTPLEHAPARL